MPRNIEGKGKQESRNNLGKSELNYNPMNELLLPMAELGTPDYSEGGSEFLSLLANIGIGTIEQEEARLRKVHPACVLLPA